MAAKVIWWCGLNRKAAPSRRAPQVVRRLRRTRLKFVREQFLLAAAAQNIKRLVRFLSPPKALQQLNRREGPEYNYFAT